MKYKEIPLTQGKMKKTIYYGSSNQKMPQSRTSSWNWFFAGVITTLLGIIVWLVW